MTTIKAKDLNASHLGIRVAVPDCNDGQVYVGVLRSIELRSGWKGPVVAFESSSFEEHVTRWESDVEVTA